MTDWFKLWCLEYVLTVWLVSRLTNQANWLNFGFNPALRVRWGDSDVISLNKVSRLNMIFLDGRRSLVIKIKTS